MWDEIFALGDCDGNIYIYNNNTDKYIHEKFSVAQGEGMIVNSLSLMQSRTSGLKLMHSNNDATVKINDVETMKLIDKLDFKDPINVAKLSPDGNLLGVYGDCIQAEIVDMRSHQIVASLHGHEDYGFSFAWHPSQNVVATGNQDRTCKLWDIRFLKNQNDRQGSYCLKTFYGSSGQVSEIRFHKDMLIFAESYDYVHIYD